VELPVEAAIPDSAILANMKVNASLKAGLGISGHANAHLSGNVNISANDGTITRFGWKAQNKSLLMFAAERRLVCPCGEGGRLNRLPSCLTAAARNPRER
jgi:CxxC motif-containing protein (DUF1111 family)